MFRSRICKLNFETNILLGTDFAQCDINEVTIPRVFNGENTLWTTSSVSERGDIHRVTLCEIKNIKMITLMGI